MFQLNRDENRISKLEKKKFSEVDIQERAHLQEWLANTPEALGEELLIIQKEFDGFDETRERLDLLALDKDGRLVIIENKLDDSGRDVVWQAVKYAAYCSSLTKNQVIDIYQAYLERYCGGGNAYDQICTFLDSESLDEIVLNQGSGQRLMLISANFRKEVTSTALWLLNHGISIQCFKITPFSFASEILIDIQQIIPPPEAAEFVIGISSKEKEENTIKTEQRRAHRLRLEFWGQALETVRVKGSSRFQSVNPTKDHWLSCGTGMSGVVYSLIFSQIETRVEVSIQRGSKDENKWVFDRLEEQKYQIEGDFGEPLVWKRLNDKKSCRIEFAKPCDGFNKENWPDMIDWLAIHTAHLVQAFEQPIAELNNELKQKRKMS